MTLLFDSFLSQIREKTDNALSDLLTVDMSEPRHRLQEAMRYAVLNGGKRVRPALCFAVAAAEQGEQVLSNQGLLDAACAIELIHSYSLVHDDLPAMDDDDLRRGKPTTHIAFDEATAVLAGDALQTKAFEILANSNDLDSDIKVGCIGELSRGAGERGMCGGQIVDLEAVGKSLSIGELSNMHKLKTGALIRSSVLIGAICSQQKDSHILSAMSDYAEAIGLAFQVKDDILDATADTSILGKPKGSDAERDKPTYVSHLGIKGAEQKLEALHQKAKTALARMQKPSSLLSELTDYIVYRAA